MVTKKRAKAAAILVTLALAACAGGRRGMGEVIPVMGSPDRYAYVITVTEKNDSPEVLNPVLRENLDRFGLCPKGFAIEQVMKVNKTLLENWAMYVVVSCDKPTAGPGSR